MHSERIIVLPACTCAKYAIHASHESVMYELLYMCTTVPCGVLVHEFPVTRAMFMSKGVIAQGTTPLRLACLNEGFDSSPFGELSPLMNRQVLSMWM